MTGPKLTQEERNSAAWQSLKKRLEARLEILRRQNDSAKLTAELTARLRGRIAEVKALIALGEDKPAIEVEAFTE